MSGSADTRQAIAVDSLRELRLVTAFAMEVAPQLRAAGITRLVVAGLEIDIGPSLDEPVVPTGDAKRAPTAPPGRGHPLNRPTTFGARGAKGPPTFKRDDTGGDDDPLPPEAE